MELFKLLEVCEVYQPKTISKKELKDDGKYKVYGANGVIGFYEKFNHEESEILLTCRGSTCGAVNVSEPFSWINGNAMVVKPIDNLLTRNYIRYFLQTIDKESVITGAAQPQITRSSLEKLKIPVPSIQEQEKIVERLDNLLKNVGEKIDISQKKIFLFENITKTYIHKIFNSENRNWKNGVISDFCTLKSGSTINKNLETLDGNLPYLKVADMNISENKKIVHTSSRFVKTENINEKSIIPPGSVIFPKRGGAIFTNKKRLTNVPIIADLNIMSVQPSSMVYPMFLYYYFLNIDMKKLVGGSSIPQINNYDIAPLKFTFPKSIEEQKEIVNKINNLESTIESLLKNEMKISNNLNILKKSLLNKEFSYE